MVKINISKTEWFYSSRNYTPNYTLQVLNKMMRNSKSFTAATVLVIVSVIFLLNLMLLENGSDTGGSETRREVPVTSQLLFKSEPQPSKNNDSTVKNNKKDKQDRMNADDIPYFLFTLDRLYLIDSGKERNVVEKPIGLKKKDIQEVILQGVTELNKLRQDQNLSLLTNQNFAEGIYKTVPREGNIYELYFGDQKNGFKANEYHKITLKRPFAPLEVVDTKRTPATKQLIHLILPVKGRIPIFKQFMRNFVKVCVKQDRKVHLTIVSYGLEDLFFLNTMVQQVKEMYNYKMINLVTLNEPFSRGKAFTVGANEGPKTDALLFLCDVDMAFSSTFLDRCRHNTERGKSVYFPIVFSQYNPYKVYPLLDMKIPRVKRRYIINKMTGAWRDYGYGMTCQYRSDFLKIKAFDGKYDEWGGEDLELYDKYRKSNYNIVRAIDPSIIHIWHEKTCNPKLPDIQYKNCVRSAAKNEASMVQLGLTVLGKKIDIHRSYKEKLILSNSDGFMIQDQLG